MIQFKSDKFKQVQLLSISEFLGNVEFNQNEFYGHLENKGEEADWFADERDDQYQNAYSEAYDDAISELGDGCVYEAEHHAHEVATQYVNQWESELTDYAETKVMYHLEDLIAAYRHASGIH